MNKVTCEHLSHDNVLAHGNLSTIPTTVSILRRENISITERRSKTVFQSLLHKQIKFY